MKLLEKHEGCSCFPTPPQPDPALFGLFRKGELVEAFRDGPEAFSEAVGRARYERISRPVIFVGAGTCGFGAGVKKTLEAIRTYVESAKVEADVVEVGCIGLCSEEPLVDIQLPGRTRVCYSKITADRVPELLKATLDGTHVPVWILGQFRSNSLREWEGVPYLEEHPFFAKQQRLVLSNCGFIDPVSLEDYLGRGGFSTLGSVLRDYTPEKVRNIVEESGLRGRGGGGFPAGKKWKIAAAAQADQRYLICNADEGDPGAFMDRAVIEGDPYRLIEGMTIAAYAMGASKAYVYTRAEYPLAVERLREALKRSEEAGFLGKGILGSSFELKIAVKMGAGAFVCGEETALIRSIEGKRGMPRPRPPYPAIAGLFGKPTIINNVETLANVPDVIRLGAAGFGSIGTASSKGTKVFALSGKVLRTGLVEVPMGTTLREIVFGIGGGIPGGNRCKAVQIGGPSGGCIPEDQLDVEVDYESLKTLGAMMGSGGMVVTDEKTCMVDLAKYFMEFIQSESCGKCIPCREGTRQMLETLRAITRDRKKESDIDSLLRFQGVLHLERLARNIRDTSLCGLGQTAPNPVLSTLRWFRAEYEAHIFERSCPAAVCRALSAFVITPDLCSGCGVCIRACPHGAIVGEKKKPHSINPELCEKCGACVVKCRFEAIRTIPAAEDLRTRGDNVKVMS